MRVFWPTSRFFLSEKRPEISHHLVGTRVLQADRGIGVKPGVNG